MVIVAWLEKIITPKQQMIHQKATQDELIIFTRFPEPGKTKTRLIPKLGDAGAAEMQQTMTEQTVRTAMKTVGNEQCNLIVYYTGGTLQQMQQWLGNGISYCNQHGTDLGQRMHAAALDSRHRGMQRTVIIGTDCPQLDSPLIGRAFAMLHDHQLVLGPSSDGGYYLIGTSMELTEKSLKQLFTNIPWGTSAVLEKTLKQARETGLSCSLLKELHDIDTPHDLKYFDHHSNA